MQGNFVKVFCHQVFARNFLSGRKSLAQECPLTQRLYAGFATLLVRVHHVPKFRAFRYPGASVVILTAKPTHIVESVLVGNLSLTSQPLVFRTGHCSHRIVLATNEGANCDDIIRLRTYLPAISLRLRPSSHLMHGPHSILAATRAWTPISGSCCAKGAESSSAIPSHTIEGRCCRIHAEGPLARWRLPEFHASGGRRRGASSHARLGDSSRRRRLPLFECPPGTKQPRHRRDDVYRRSQLPPSQQEYGRLIDPG